MRDQDLKKLMNLLETHTRELKEISKYLKKIAKHLHFLTSSPEDREKLL